MNTEQVISRLTNPVAIAVIVLFVISWFSDKIARVFMKNKSKEKQRVFGMIFKSCCGVLMLVGLVIVMME